MDQACCVSRSCLCAAATSTQLITLLFIPNNGRGWNKSEPRTLCFFTGKVQTGTLKRASGFKRYSLSFLMERNRKWRHEAGLCDLYTASVAGEKSKSVSLSTPLVCSRSRSNHNPVAFSASLQHHQNTLALCLILSREITQQENLYI